MIRIFVGAPAKTGFYPYRIDGHWGPNGAPLLGIAEDPVAEACRVLQALGVSVRRTLRVIPHTGREIDGTITAWLQSPVKALPAPRRRSRKRLLVMGSGIPGDE